MSDCLLEFREITAGYGHPVAGPVSFAANPGEVLGLAGVNGAGKTTLLKVITGEARIFSGELLRRPGLSIAHHRQRPERPPELPLTGSEVLRLMGANRNGVPERLAALGSRCLDEMSGGEFQLLQAWACLRGPAKLVLLDEPTNNLDQWAIDLLLDELRQLAIDRSVMLVSHEKRFLESACHRVIEL